MTTTNTDNTPEDEFGAPLDMLLVNSTKSFASRMMPNAAWARMAQSLAGKPVTVAERGAGLVKELGLIAAGKSQRAPKKGDFRFSDPAWKENPLLRRVEQAYLAASDTADQLYEDADLDWKDAEKMRFVLDNAIEGLSPTNSPLLNPLGWKALIDTGGLSALRGAKNFARDMSSTPRIPSMIDPDAYTVGETLATTKGTVVLRTRMFELIHYAPQTKQVREVPILLVPPVINKFYIMDIAPGRSLIEYYVKGGQQVFAISWRNPSARHRDWGFDEYGESIVKALDALEVITGADKANIFATCSGGILTSMMISHLFATGHGDRVAGLTLGVTVLDQSHAGLGSALASERGAEAAIRSSASKGYLDGAAMAEMFAWLRPTDLVWRYWVNNYIQGKSPAPFDVLFWNADTTRMAANLHKDMVTMGLNNTLVTPGEQMMMGTPVDLSKVECDAYVLGGISDHICPWQATERSAALLGSKDNTYVLSTAGHIAALVNPPGNPKSSFRTGPVLQDQTPEEWFEAAEKQAGSWWPHHLAWLNERSGAEVDAPAQLGAPGYEPLAPAPGTFVHEK
ncbi:alpha/beta fold hydrolase [Tsukamurella tyrosinosolvens]|uniref:Polyhydroxyalkanoate synthase n=2 Tax=Tsukamurella TaxID=2060 RepID=A0A1H5BWE3_TSUTY|nr:alpha/beta fold hydrolase [Tsukamurella tyrosinosolvens]AUN42433.1 poly(3-hydroxyalkanoate) polymerase [Tsukamurella tyrosinosolvens]KXO92622.1 poly(3-hydroxyalkanoate) polymerase [Tsukamurella tyrosinosolvens]KXP01674.1 poly(3-hydroxyalkanoate) polymerase [Tsukamurella tyrosinosolvens]KZL94863.1 poly(3-hydroxyalkanoate) polymerase [Tsukamurella tyrosinosolvens]MCA4997636.1 alpha/beta fold hydrolase [Tsukamurella tyrosinosolvens]